MKRQDVPREGMEWTEQLLDSLPASLFVTTLSGELLFANRACREQAPGQRELYRRMLEYAGRTVGFWEEAAVCGMVFQLGGPAGQLMDLQCGAAPWGEEEALLFLGRDSAGQEHSEAYIRQVVSMDGLTGLPGRSRCLAALQECLELEDMAGKGYLALLEPEELGLIADGYGKELEEGLLLEIAGFLASRKGPGDRLYRLDNRFALLIAPANAGGAEELTDAIRQRALEPWMVAGKELLCGIAIGAAPFPDGRMDGASILKNAESALSEAQLQDKNTCFFYTEKLRDLFSFREELETRMRDDITHGFRNFYVFYQPWVELEGGRIAGAEALLRWIGPEGKPISPRVFVPLAEYLGLMEPLGGFALEQACQFLRKLNDQGFADFAISANLSPRQLRQEGVLWQVERALKQSRANPDNFLLEIAESPTEKDLHRAEVLCGEFQRLGLSITLDSFGSGSASLSSLRTLPLSLIKLDRGLMDELGTARHAPAMVRMITDFAHAVGKSVCAKGVESRSQLDYCRFVGVDMVQGFFYHRPMPGEELAELLSEPERLSRYKGSAG